MIYLSDRQKDEPSECPYLENRARQFDYFFACDLEEEDIARLLSEGWRKFGIYYFRPACPGCLDCIPIRIPARDFVPSRDQKRSIKKNSDLEVLFVKPRFNERIYEIYRGHSLGRFGEASSSEEFLQSFYMPSCPSLQSEYYLDGKLIAAGFLDVGSDCISSVYFIYDTAYSSRGLGTYSVVREVEYAREQGLKYYYLGYYVERSEKMSYKGRFMPRQEMDWKSGIWTEKG